MNTVSCFKRKAKGKEYSEVEMQYSIYHLLLGNPVWWCRIWQTDWIECVKSGKKELGQAYGKTKFEAYRNALKDLTTPTP